MRDVVDAEISSAPGPSMASMNTCEARTPLMYPESYPKKMPPNEAKAHLHGGRETGQRARRPRGRCVPTVGGWLAGCAHSHHVRLESDGSLNGVGIRHGCGSEQERLRRTRCVKVTGREERDGASERKRRGRGSHPGHEVEQRGSLHGAPSNGSVALLLALAKGRVEAWGHLQRPCPRLGQWRTESRGGSAFKDMPWKNKCCSRAAARGWRASSGRSQEPERCRERPNLGLLLLYRVPGDRGNRDAVASTRSE